MPADDDERYRLVEVFPDYARSVIWFTGPIEYGDTGISSELQASMEAWEQFYYAHVGYGAESSPELQAEFDAEGARIGQALANEIGAEFTVEYRSETPGVTAQRFTAAASPTNPAAHAAFTRISEAMRRDDEQLRQHKAEVEARGGKLSFFAHAPISGETYREN